MLMCDFIGMGVLLNFEYIFRKPFPKNTHLWWDASVIIQQDSKFIGKHLINSFPIVSETLFRTLPNILDGALLQKY